MKVLYLPLERYAERYTANLQDWIYTQMLAEGVEVIVSGSSPSDLGSITAGRVLDAGRRPMFAANQIATIIEQGLLDDEELDWVWVDDMFHPGYEALPYYRHLTGARWRIAVRNWAQSVDVHDFTWPMRRWMRHYELMVSETADLVFCGSDIHREHMLIAGYDAAKVFAVGLPFDGEWCRWESKRHLSPWAGMKIDIVYTSRVDPEKQPDFMLRVAKLAKETKDWNTVICTGMKADDFKEKLGQPPKGVSIASELTRGQYYGLVREAKVHLNTSLQDYVSYGLLDASALGVPSVLPCYRSFPEEQVEKGHFYVPWSAHDALRALGEARHSIGRVSDPPALAPSNYHSLTVARSVELMGEVAR